jgi:hypothetical protein
VNLDLSYLRPWNPCPAELFTEPLFQEAVVMLS